jgi:hypothetical protein
MKAIGVVLVGMMLVGMTGCTSYSKQYDEASEKLVQTQKQNEALQKTIKDLQETNAQCQQQVVTLSGMTAEQRKEAIPTVTEVKITKRSGIYPRETESRKTHLLIYFRPIDDTGDAVKAPGTVHVELWDLGEQPAQAMLAKWDVSANELKKSWSGSLLADFYRLAFDVPDDYMNRKNLTVKLTFTDHLTGRVFAQQMAVSGR